MTITKFEKELLTAHFLKKSRAHVMAHPQEINHPEWLSLIKRREAGEPMAYILGEKEFWSLVFTINKDVLIPRPETELLIDILLEKFDKNKSWRFLELGTGSGAISITLGKHYPHSQIMATDISENALKIAMLNQEKHQVKNVMLKKSDWFSKIVEKFDVIISNPPYIAETDPHLLEGDLRFEPRLALTSGKTGLEAITKIISHAKDYLLPDGWVVLEHGYNQKDSIHEFFKQYGYVEVTTKNDLNHLPRVTFARRSGIN